MVTWGHSDRGGDSKKVQAQLLDVQSVYCNDKAFAAVKSDSSIVAWGDVDAQKRLNGVAEAIIKSLVLDSRQVLHFLNDVQSIHSNEKAFAVKKSDGSIVAWGDAEAQTKLDGVAKSITQNGGGSATAALKTDGSVVTWGAETNGGDCSKVQEQLVDVWYIYASEYAFAALKADGSVVSWGTTNALTSISESFQKVRHQLVDVRSIHSTSNAFAALKADGSVVAWGWGQNPGETGGGDTSKVQDQLVDVRSIYSTERAFAAVKADGTIVTWGYKGRLDGGVQAARQKAIEETAARSKANL